MKLPAHIQMGGNKIKVQKIKQALDFADPKAMMDFIKIASSSSKQDKTNQMHLLLQALQWISGEFATMNQEYASKPPDVSDLQNLLLYIAQGWDKGILDLSGDSVGPSFLSASQPQATAQPALGLKR